MRNEERRGIVFLAPCVQPTCREALVGQFDPVDPLGPGGVHLLPSAWRPRTLPPGDCRVVGSLHEAPVAF